MCVCVYIERRVIEEKAETYQISQKRKISCIKRLGGKKEEGFYDLLLLVLHENFLQVNKLSSVHMQTERKKETVRVEKTHSNQISQTISTFAFDGKIHHSLAEVLFLNTCRRRMLIEGRIYIYSWEEFVCSLYITKPFIEKSLKLVNVFIKPHRRQGEACISPFSVISLKVTIIIFNHLV